MRRLRWGFIVFQCIWLNAVVPGHTRGKLTVPGSKPVGPVVQATSHGCCAVPRETPPQDGPERPLDPGRCAVCHYAIGLTLPPVFSFDHRPAGVVGVAPVPVVVVTFVADVPLSISARGPPAGIA